MRLFKQRWSELKLVKPRGLEIQRTKATNTAIVLTNYTELGNILDKYDLKNKPERNEYKMLTKKFVNFPYNAFSSCKL
ncbi:hypothetical protein DPMN_124506 [Dreissena polymorpha]|uniref:Uncharacterized protein n=1 Tax=Dreissena polymorpha TaxID=45954 RepID=A0A9D4GWG6_DREPO|nr:hypothetical protein DPMN_124506 [Dreissena polymorpha]